MTNAYLLCRIADTIEDEPALSPAETLALLERFKGVVARPRRGRGACRATSRSGFPSRTLPTERDLVVNMARVLQVTASLSPPQRAAIQRCVELMCYGMPQFQRRRASRACPPTDLDEYCYYVAGVVGEMLTELFCDYSPDIAQQPRAACRASRCRSRRACR